MNDIPLQDRAAIVETIARAAGKIALGHFERLASVPVEAKGHLDLVTAADQEVERFVTDRLAEAFPDDGVFGEEGAAQAGSSGHTWVIDPIDGTFNFVRGGDQWAVSIGLYQDRRPALGVLHVPVRNQMLTGGDGLPATLNGAALAPRSGLDPARAACGLGFHPAIPVEKRIETLRFVMEDAGMTFRLCGSAVLSLIELARGQVDGYIGLGESSWDLMAALPILHQLGIRDTIDWDRATLDSKFRFACGTPEFLDVVSGFITRGETLQHDW